MSATENRRRKTALDVRKGADQHDRISESNRPRRKKKRTFGLSLRRMLLRSRSAVTWKLPDSTLVVLISTVAFLFVLKPKIIFSPPVPSLNGSTSAFQKRYHDRNELVEQHTELYDATYKLSSERLLPPDQTVWPEYERRPYELKSTYGDAIQTCEITILVTDPRLAFPKYLGGPGQPIWFALESVGAFASDACVLLQTCKFQLVHRTFMKD
jgi:hypothetical protein